MSKPFASRLVKVIAPLMAVCGLLLAAPAFARGAPDGFADLSQKLSPAVVNVSTTQTLKRASGDLPFPPGSPFDDFFKQFGQPNGARPIPPRFVVLAHLRHDMDPCSAK